MNLSHSLRSSLFVVTGNYLLTYCGRWVVRLTTLAAVAGLVGSIENILEDGFGWSWLFLVFVASLWATLACLLGMAVLIAMRRRGRERYVALIPAGAAIGVVAFVEAGGVIMLVTWLAATFVSYAITASERNASALASAGS